MLKSYYGEALYLELKYLWRKKMQLLGGVCCGAFFCGKVEEIPAYRIMESAVGKWKQKPEGVSTIIIIIIIINIIVVAGKGCLVSLSEFSIFI